MPNFLSKEDEINQAIEILEQNEYEKHNSFRDLIKSLTNSFKPYKHNKQKNRDYLQLLKGLVNIFIGIAMIFSITWRLMVISKLSLEHLFGSNSQLTLSQKLNYGCISELYILKNSFKNFKLLPLGISQLVTSPLLLFVIPLRTILTVIFGSPSILANKGLQREVKKYFEASNRLDLTLELKTVQMKQAEGKIAYKLFKNQNVNKQKGFRACSFKYEIKRDFLVCPSITEPTLGNIEFYNESHPADKVIEELQTKMGIKPN